eukprot:CAMPEP_0184376958 /NCGR_PEP_ID=MMETSP0007-20130409/1869_1 /TAXON_ID=97485 /ORGANISM="Prymnesium parvum, Strain Texoma1" /LENGTH=103 /DNA_ID=CAMNT_0026720681 /DNA_START=401 /DNA_END=709 /DNA_ORIENTATION=+
MPEQAVSVLAFAVVAEEPALRHSVGLQPVEEVALLVALLAQAAEQCLHTTFLRRLSTGTPGAGRGSGSSGSSPSISLRSTSSSNSPSIGPAPEKVEWRVLDYR